MNRAESSIKFEPADRQINRTKGYAQNSQEQFRSVHRTMLHTALATVLVAAASLLTAAPAQAAVAYPMKSTQSVLVGPTSSAKVMGTVFDGERVSLFCYETTAGELWDYIEYCSSPSRTSRAIHSQSRLSVLTRSPDGRSIFDGANT